MSIRTFLSLVIAVMGAALIAVVGAWMIAEIERSNQARDVAALARISETLLPAMVSSRIDRSTVEIATMAAEPADPASWARLAEQRPIADAMCERSVAALRRAPLADAAALVARITATHDALKAIRPEIDAAIRLPRAERDSALVQRYLDVSATYIYAITAAAQETEQATALFDPQIDRLIYLGDQASAARNYTSLITYRMEASDAFNLPWRPQDVIEAAQNRGRADHAWDQVLAVSTGSGIPDTLHQAIDAAKAALTGPDARRQADLIAELQAGRPNTVPISDLQRLNTGLMESINDVVRASASEIVALATRYQQDAQRNVVGTGAMLLAVLCLTGFGLAVVHQRVSTPLHRITRQMARLNQAALKQTELASEDPFLAEDAGRRDEIGEMARALIAFRHQVEEHGRRLQEQEMRQFLEALIDAMPVSITFKDTDMRYRYANRFRRAVLGESGGLLVGKRLSEVTPGDAAEPVEAADRALLATGEPQAFEQARTAPDGTPAIVWSLKTPFRDTDGTIRGIITCGVNITRLKHIEAELKAQSEKAEAANRAKSAFLASMSHELRTPLNAIIGFADALATGYLGSLGDRQREYIGDIRSSGEHLLKLVNDLLDLSSLEIGRQILVFTECRFDSVAVAAINMVQPQAAQAGVRLEFAPTGVALQADERALTQILVNLLGNAIKFSAAGGRIALRAIRDRDAIRIQVEDSGLGMTEAQRVSALSTTLSLEDGLGVDAADPYKRRPKGGVGLGLAICRRLIEQHNGTLDIESESGRGSTVNVVLPAA